MIQICPNNKLKIKKKSLSMKKYNLSNLDCRILNWFGFESPNWFKLIWSHQNAITNCLFIHYCLFKLSSSKRLFVMNMYLLQLNVWTKAYSINFGYKLFVKLVTFLSIINFYHFNCLPEASIQGCHKKWKTNFPDFSLTNQQNFLTILKLHSANFVSRNSVGDHIKQYNDCIW